MPGVGVGGLFANLFNPGLDERLAQHITPNPNPLAQQGQGAQPGTVDSLGNPRLPAPPPGSNLAPPASTQPDPVNASYAADLLKAYRGDQMAQGINQGLGEITAGFGTAQQQASKQAALARGGGVGDSLGALAGIQKMQDQTIQDNEHARFMGNAAVFAQTLSTSLGRPVSVQEATEIMNNKGLMDQFGQAAATNAQTTSTQKDADAATREWAKANPNATPQDIADYKANLIAGGMGGTDLETRQYLGERQAAIAAGQKDFPDFATWKAQKGAEATTLKTTAEEEAQNKVAAQKDYPTIDQTLSRSEEIIKKLLANKQATIDAINTMPSRKTGWWAANTPWGASEEIRTAAADLQTLMSTLAGSSLKDVKNVRNRMEFGALADSLTAGLKAGNTDAGIEDTLNGLLKKFDGTRAIAREQAGLPALEKKEDGGDGGGGAVKRRHYNEKGELVD
jgi:hypothetical protein